MSRIGSSLFQAPNASAAVVDGALLAAAPKVLANPAVPNHIAIVMDGNGRWATQRYLPRMAGHKQGVDALSRCVKACVQRGIGVLTVFAFSSENWNRPVDEVSSLMELMVLALSL